MKPMCLADHRRGGLLGVVFLHTPLLDLGRNLFAAFGAATAQHQTAGMGRHALHETVYVGAVALFWLKRSFWHMLSLYSIICCQTSCVPLRP